MTAGDDDHLIDVIAAQVRECQELGIPVPEDMPMDTPEHRRAAVDWLGRLIFRKKRGLNTW